MNNQSDKPENREPRDSKRKHINHPQDDNESVVKPRDKQYKKADADFGNPAKTKESSEQPVHPVKREPKDV